MRRELTGIARPYRRDGRVIPGAPEPTVNLTAEPYMDAGGEVRRRCPKARNTIAASTPDWSRRQSVGETALCGNSLRRTELADLCSRCRRLAGDDPEGYRHASGEVMPGHTPGPHETRLGRRAR